MCLLPFMMGGGPNRAQVAAPPEAKKMQNYLYILAGIHLVMMITLMSALGVAGLNELFNVMFLMCGAYSMNFCIMIFYIIIMFNDCISYFCAVGYLIQLGEFAKCYTTSPNCNGFQATMLILFFIFSIAAVTLSFYAYRVFKAKDLGLLEGHLNIGGAQVGGGNRNRDEENDGYQPAYIPPSQPQNNQNANYQNNARPQEPQ